MSSRTMSGVQRSATISVARATGQYCLYFCMLHRGTAGRCGPVQEMNWIGAIPAMRQARCARMLDQSRDQAIPNAIAVGTVRGVRTQELLLGTRSQALQHAVGGPHQRVSHRGVGDQNPEQRQQLGGIQWMTNDAVEPAISNSAVGGHHAETALQGE